MCKYGFFVWFLCITHIPDLDSAGLLGHYCKVVNVKSIHPAIHKGRFWNNLQMYSNLHNLEIFHYLIVINKHYLFQDLQNTVTWTRLYTTMFFMTFISIHVLFCLLWPLSYFITLFLCLLICTAHHVYNCYANFIYMWTPSKISFVLKVKGLSTLWMEEEKKKFIVITYYFQQEKLKLLIFAGCFRAVAEWYWWQWR